VGGGEEDEDKEERVPSISSALYILLDAWQPLLSAVCHRESTVLYILLDAGQPLLGAVCHRESIVLLKCSIQYHAAAV